MILPTKAQILKHLPKVAIAVEEMKICRNALQVTYYLGTGIRASTFLSFKLFPTKQPRQPKEIINLSESLWKVTGDTGNIYLVDIINGRATCQCKAAENKLRCYHATAVEAAAQPQPLSLKETPRQRNQQLLAEFNAAIKLHGVGCGEIDFLSFSAPIVYESHIVGHIGCSVTGRYWVAKKHGNSYTVKNFDEAIALLTGKVSDSEIIERQPMYAI